jgi:glycosyltransferase involved in cell wall biosynthesis
VSGVPTAPVIDDPLLVSVILPVFNGERFVRDTIESVLRQTYRPLDVVVVDDGSTDGSMGIIRTFRQIRWVSHPNCGVSAARNTGVEASSGPFLAFIDQDDLWLPDKIEQQMRVLREDPSVDYVLTWQTRFVQPGVPRPAWVRPESIDVPLRAFDPSALLVRRSSFLRVGVFDVSYATAPDADWFFRAKDAGLRGECVPAVLVSRRIHAANSSRNPSGTAELRRVARASIMRQRHQRAPRV